MKRILYLALLCTPLISFGQSFSFQSSDTLEKTYDAGDFVSDYIHVRNDGDASVSLNFVVLSNTIESNGWHLTLCTNRYCYPEAPSSGSLGSIGSGKSGFFNPKVGFNDIAGTGEFVVRVYEAGNPSNADTLAFIFNAEGMSAVTNVAQENVILYPNPATDVINIKGIENVATSRVEILNSFGQVVLLATQNFSRNTSLQVGELTAGHYNIVVYAENGSQRVLSFVKQ